MSVRRSASVARVGVLAGLFLFALRLPQPPPVASAPPLTLTDVNGKAHRPLETKDNRATVFFFLAHDCPISNGYAPEMNRIQTTYAPKKVGFYFVYTEAQASGGAAVLGKHAKEFGYRAPTLWDPKHLLVKRVGAKVTPEAAVLTPDGKVRYRGRIDNTYAALGVRRNAATVRDLRDALDAVLADRPVAHPTTDAVGCDIMSD